MLFNARHVSLCVVCAGHHSRLKYYRTLCDCNILDTRIAVPPPHIIPPQHYLATTPLPLALNHGEQLVWGGEDGQGRQSVCARAVCAWVCLSGYICTQNRVCVRRERERARGGGGWGVGENYLHALAPYRCPQTPKPSDLNPIPKPCNPSQKTPAQTVGPGTVVRACAGGADECACAWAVSGGGALRGLFFFSLSFFPVFFSPVFCLDSERERERERDRLY